MTRKIRADLVGVVHLPDGQVVKAGDEVPEDVEVGDHLFDPEETEKKPARRSARTSE